MKEVSSEEWIICTPPAGIQATRLTVESLKENAEYNFRVCAINSEGVGEPADVHGSVTASEKIEAPEIELDADLRKVVSVRAGGSLRLFITIRGRPEPSVKWEKEDGTLTERAQIESTSSYTMLVIDNVNRFDSGKYNLTLENKSGTKSAFVNVRVLDTPSSPQKFEVKDVKKNSVTLCWDPPLTDGGAKITNYVVEKRESTRKAYTTVTSNCTQTSFKVDELQEGGIFYFRVCAVNDSSVSLSWGKPATNGGAYIKGYIVEMKEVSSEEWIICTPPAGIQATRLTVESLKENAEYNFRVCAINSEGVGEPADVHGSVTASEKIEAPEIELDADLRKVVSVRAGGSLRLFITIRGRPEPSVKWEKEDGTLTERAQIESTSSYTMLVIDNVNRFDSGKYNLTLENKSGTKSAFVNVRVLDTPSSPQKFEVKDVKKDSVTLCWYPPLTDGGAKITNYVVEKRESTRKAYTTVTSNCTQTSFKVDELQEGGIFYFRVCAVNEYGFGVMAETKNPIKVAQVPMPPGKVTLVDVTKNSVTLTWVKPVHDGGSKIICYNVEMQPKSSDKWGVSCTVKVPEATVSNLTPGETYSFRVTALNEKGKSEPQELGVPVVAKDIEIEPSVHLLFNTYSVKAGDDLTVEVPVRGRPKPVVSWKKDETSRLAWTLVHGEVKTTTFKVTKLLKGNEYIFRVLAVNKFGLGEALQSEMVKVTEPYTIPGAPTNVEITSVTSEEMRLAWTKSASDGGSEILGYIIERRDKSGLHWVRVNRDLVKDLTAVISKVRRGCEYEFRVYAENSAGLSPASDPSPSARAEDELLVPSPPTKPKILDHTKNSITIAWKKPLSDGGAQILGYSVEYKNSEDTEWIVAIQMTKSNEFTVSGLTTDVQYVFAVKAINKVGVSEQSPVSESQSAMERKEEPVFDIDIEMRKTLIVKHGNSFTLTAPFKGKPVPSVTWNKEEVDLKARASIETTETCTSVTIEKATRNDSGQYIVTLDNGVGTASLPVMVKVLDTPGPPTNVKITEVTKNSVTIAWSKPEYDGGSRITSYLIDALEKGQQKWVKCATVKANTHIIKNLRENAEYFFRVRAENHAGLSEPKEMIIPVVVKDQLDAPEFDMKNFPHNTVYVRAGSNLKFELPLSGKPMPKVTMSRGNAPVKCGKRFSFEVTPEKPPANVRISEVTKNSISLVWQKPPFDGGSKITGYIVERRDAPNGRWTKANFTNVIDTNFTVSGLTQDQAYEFRIFAKNAVGSISNPSLIAGPVTCVDISGKFIAATLLVISCYHAQQYYSHFITHGSVSSHS
uniref:Titin n=1 Tax=Sinocyclocheilus anshuiensis TaxID=1608454 RepID=A0A671S1G6_9TELE